MRRRWTLCLAIFFCGWTLSRLPWNECLRSWAAGGTGVDGDVNGDGTLNIGDPVYLLRFLFQGGPGPASCRAAAKPISVAFIVRHAEKASTPADDPCLTDEGKERARRLAEVFKYAKVDRLIASEKCRTKETLDPLAEQQEITAMDRVGDEGELEKSADGVAAFLKGYPPGTVTVIAHHSTTIRAILEKLGIPKDQAATVSTSAYDNLILVLLPAGQDPQIVKLRY
ncbi:MAG: histidine phosphatase family protein [Planctomycetes bacterium]|nr:histidine phosphatase family protein [Planctomycetota bacterium]